LPLAHLENAIRLAANLRAGVGADDLLRIDGLCFYAPGTARFVLSEPDGGRSRILDADGRITIDVERLAFDRPEDRSLPLGRPPAAADFSNAPR
jgi:hypothetical protein